MSKSDKSLFCCSGKRKISSQFASERKYCSLTALWRLQFLTLKSLFSSDIQSFSASFGNNTRNEMNPKDVYEIFPFFLSLWDKASAFKTLLKSVILELEKLFFGVFWLCHNEIYPIPPRFCNIIMISLIGCQFCQRRLIPVHFPCNKKGEFNCTAYLKWLVDKSCAMLEIIGVHHVIRIAQLALVISVHKRTKVEGHAICFFKALCQANAVYFHSDVFEQVTKKDYFIFRIFMP